MKIFTGRVISTKMQETATVAVKRVVAHPIYKKRIRKVKKYHAHDEMGAKVGQIVKFVASKPFSKTKKWKVIGVVGGDEVNKSTKGSFSKTLDRKTGNTKSAENKRKSARRKKKGVKK